MSAPLVTIRLAGEPHGKGRPRFSRTSGRAFTPAATRSYEDALRYAAQQAMGDREPIKGPLVVVITAGMPIANSKSSKWRAAALAGEIHPEVKPDFDNLAKVVDALNQVVWVDDKQIVDGRVIKAYSERPALTIEVSAR